MTIYNETRQENVAKNMVRVYYKTNSIFKYLAEKFNILCNKLNIHK